jgi:small subunit ribosomal protein S20
VANSPQAQKRARQNEKRRLHNASLRSRMRTFIKKVRNAVGSGDRDLAEQAYKEATPVIDSMARKGLVHKNKAARFKSRLNAQIRQMP